MSGVLPIPHFEDLDDKYSRPESSINYPESLYSLDTVEDTVKDEEDNCDIFEDLRRAEIDPDLALRLIAKVRLDC